MHDLGTLGGSHSLGNGINNSGQIVGYSDTIGDTATHAFVFDSTGMHDLGTLGGTSSQGYGINNSGQVVGYSGTTAGGPGRFPVPEREDDRPQYVAPCGFRLDSHGCVQHQRLWLDDGLRLDEREYPRLHSASAVHRHRFARLQVAELVGSRAIGHVHISQSGFRRFRRHEIHYTIGCGHSAQRPFGRVYAPYFRATFPVEERVERDGSGGQCCSTDRDDPSRGRHGQQQYRGRGRPDDHPFCLQHSQGGR